MRIKASSAPRPHFLLGVFSVFPKGEAHWLKGREITGYVSFLRELGSLELLTGHLDAYLKRLGVV